jgi:hypothetical protein
VRFLPALTALLLAAGHAWAWPAAAPAPAKGGKAPKVRLFVPEPTHPDADLGLVLAYLEAASPEVRPYLVFFAFPEVPGEVLGRVVTTWRYAVNKVSTSPGVVRGAEVPGSGGRLWAVDYREPRWNLPAVLAVAARDRRYREPHVSPALARRLRELTGGKQDPKTFHLGVVLPGAWFAREVLETDRSPAYYDLLYAGERFGGAAPGWAPYDTTVTADRTPVGDLSGAFKAALTRGQAVRVTHQTDNPKLVYVAAGGLEGYCRAADLAPAPAGPAAARDFPATDRDFDKKWGAAAARDFLKAEKLRVAVGAVVAGAKSDPVRGSYVAYQDRVLYLLQTPLGVYMRTFDSLKTAGKRNYADKDQVRRVLLEDLEFDAGEFLASMPNGLQAALLTDGNGKRVEFADSRVARNTRDPVDVTVKTSIACDVCHAPQYGVLAPTNNKVLEAIGRGVRLLDKDPEVRAELEGFFKGLDASLPVWRVRYQVALVGVTASPADPKGWTGQRLAAELLAFRDGYDAPVGPDQAAAELGYPKLAVILAALVDGSVDAGNLVAGGHVPRTVWDEDLLPRLALVLSAARRGESGDDWLDCWVPEMTLTTPPEGRRP